MQRGWGGGGGGAANLAGLAVFRLGYAFLLGVLSVFFCLDGGGGGRFLRV